MDTARLACLAFLMSISFKAAPESAVATEKPTRIHCVNSAAGTCVVPIGAIYSGSLNDYRDQVVITTGYLRTFGGTHLLFPDKSLAEFAPKESAIALVDNQKRFSDDFKLNSEHYVRVSGRLRPVSDANVEYWAEMELTFGPQQLATTIDWAPAKPAQ